MDCAPYTHSHGNAVSISGSTATFLHTLYYRAEYSRRIWLTLIPAFIPKASVSHTRLLKLKSKRCNNYGDSYIEHRSWRYIVSNYNTVSNVHSNWHLQALHIHIWLPPWLPLGQLLRQCTRQTTLKGIWTWRWLSRHLQYITVQMVMDIVRGIQWTIPFHAGFIYIKERYRCQNCLTVNVDNQGINIKVPSTVYFITSECLMPYAWSRTNMYRLI